MNTIVRTLSIALLAGGLLIGCDGTAPKPSATANTPTPATTAKATTAATTAQTIAKATPPPTKQDAKPTGKDDGKVFDPQNPPEGYTRCHRGHCHTVDGRVVSYQQVMSATGATRIAGGGQIAAMPAAPPDVAAPPQDAARTQSGLASKVLSKGTGTEHPTADSVVKVHYTGWTTDGKAFDSSVARGKPITFPLSRVIPGWTEGVQLMVQGEERRFWIPEELAYKGRPGAPQGMLVFDVTLLEIMEMPKR